MAGYYLIPSICMLSVETIPKHKYTKSGYPKHLLKAKQMKSVHQIGFGSQQNSFVCISSAVRKNWMSNCFPKANTTPRPDPPKRESEMKIDNKKHSSKTISIVSRLLFVFSLISAIIRHLHFWHDHKKYKKLKNKW